MGTTALATLAGLVLAGFAAAAGALLLISLLVGRREAAPAPLPETVAFLFDGDTLADSSSGALNALAAVPPRGSDLDRVTAWLSARFPALAGRLSEPGDLHESFSAVDGSGRLYVDRTGLQLRLSLDTEPAPLAFEPDRHSLDAMTDELEMLRSVAELTHVPVWRQRRDGQITWANAAYLDLAERSNDEGETAIWPPRALFDRAALAEMEAVSSRRMRLQTGDDLEGHWYDCYAAAAGDDLLVTAVPADPVVKAEEALRDFVQTLTKTFAHLSVGLAIFDKKRQLALFNPALTDLLPLPVAFLSARPTLLSFLDQLRERRLMPEPKDYKTWRQRIADLEEAATDGVYSETWSLPGGQTYRVTGRPHPGGGVAFLFEDISDEISLTRRFRAELEMGQAVFDSLDEAVAVFSAGGVLVMSNRAYADLWSVDPSTTPQDITFTEATRRWLEMCQPTPVWGDAREFATMLGDRADWSAEVIMRNGRPLTCRFVQLPGGATLVGFSDTTSAPALAAPQPALISM